MTPDGALELSKRFSKATKPEDRTGNDVVREALAAEVIRLRKLLLDAKQDTLDLLEHIEAQDRQIIRMREALEWMVSPASDWENAEIGVGYRFRNHARAALSLLERKRK